MGDNHMEQTTSAGPLVYDEQTISRVFKRPKSIIREWMSSGYLPARWLQDGRPVVLHDELVEMLRGLPRERQR
jgi:hypothetical protein